MIYHRKVGLRATMVLCTVVAALLLSGLTVVVSRGLARLAAVVEAVSACRP